MNLKVSLVFLALCLLSASAWLLDELAPSPLPLFFQLAAVSAFLCSATFFATERSRSAPKLDGLRFTLYFWSAVLFVLPAVLGRYSAKHLSATTIALCFTLVPAALSFLLAQSQQADLLQQLGPSLAGVAGAALILPFEFPSSTSGRVALAITVCSAFLTALAIIRFRELARDVSYREALFHAAFSSFLLSGPLSVVSWQPMAVHAEMLLLLSAGLHLLLYGVIFALSVYLVRQLPATAFATRFLLVPLLTILEGYFILRPENTWTLGLGVLLIAAAVTMLLRESVIAQNALAISRSARLN